MAIKLIIEGKEFRDTAEALRTVGKKQGKALISAMNHTGQRARTQVQGALVKTTGIKSRDLGRSKGLRTKFANQTHPDFELVARSITTPLAYFDAVKAKRGVRARPWGNRQVFETTFLATMPNGKVGVFKRVNAKARSFIGPRQQDARTKTGKLKIKELWGPSLAREMMKFPVPQIWDDEIAARLPARIVHEVGVIMAGLRKPRRKK